MLFNSIDFLIFFPIVIIVLLLIPARFRQLWLLVCSYFFYMCWNPACILLILFSTVVTFFSPILMEKANEQNKKKIIVAVCLSVNLALLFFFKYFNFVRGTVGFIVRKEFEPLNILLPVGISFYTFQALGYTLDCYRGNVKIEKNFIQYALFVSFFPQLVAGPIERSSNLLGQLESLLYRSRRELINFSNMRNGFILMAWGMFMKVVIADRVAILVDNVYENIYLYGTAGLFLAFVGFGLQIYCDFNSYSSIAIGAARFIGVNLMENFNAPYLSTSVSSFWRRWHISLSSWFRDYLYIPLGGSRRGIIRKSLNIMIVFLCSGLWHGANWTFVFWGGLHGLAVIVETLLKPLVNKMEAYFDVNKKSVGFVLCRAIIVTTFVNFAWVFFRADNFTQAFEFIRRLFTKPDWWILSDGTVFKYGLDVIEMFILAFSVMLLVIVDLIRDRKGVSIDKWLCNEFAGFRVGFLVLIIFITIAFGVYGPSFDSTQFLYFQF